MLGGLLHGSRRKPPLGEFLGAGRVSVPPIYSTFPKGRPVVHLAGSFIQQACMHVLLGTVLGCRSSYVGYK